MISKHSYMYGVRCVSIVHYVIFNYAARLRKLHFNLHNECMF